MSGRAGAGTSPGAGTRRFLRAVRSGWSRYRGTVLPLAIGLLSVLALLKLGTELYRLLVDTGFHGAIDLRLRYQEVQAWFAGRPVYTELSRLTYPPQAYVMLWPFTGWLSWEGARWVWALTSLAALAWLCALVLRETGTTGGAERGLAIAMIVGMNAVGVTIGNGQLIVHVLPALVAALLLLRRPRAAWYVDAGTAALLLFALVKPTLSVPFAWLAMLTTRRVRPLAWTVIGYILLTLGAAAFQPENAFTLVAQWAGQGGSDLGEGYGDVHSALLAIGQERWAAAASLLLLAGLGIWTWSRRQSDPWVLLGVTAIVARLWTYHRSYDDVLIVLPMVALLRIAAHPDSDEWDAVRAGLLLAVAIPVMATPAALVGGVDSSLFVGSHVAVWLVMLLFLARLPAAALPIRLSPPPPPPPPPSGAAARARTSRRARRHPPG